MIKVLVTGGTGTLGRHLVPRLAADHSVRVLTRRPRPSDDEAVRFVRGDLVSGHGLIEATHAVDAIVHCASNARQRSWKTDIDGTARLIDAARQSNATPHLIYISIVGIDRHPFKYYRAKRAAEIEIERSGLPWTVLRTTQWFELLHFVLERFTRLGMTFVPRDFPFQPMAASEAAARLARAASAKPAGLLPDVGGPAVRSVEDLAEAWMKARGSHTRLVRYPFPGKAGRAFREGMHLAPDRAVGRVTWESWLDKNLAVSDAGKGSA